MLVCITNVFFNTVYDFCKMKYNDLENLFMMDYLAVVLIKAFNPNLVLKWRRIPRL